MQHCNIIYLECLFIVHFFSFIMQFFVGVYSLVTAIEANDRKNLDLCSQIQKPQMQEEENNNSNIFLMYFTAEIMEPISFMHHLMHN